MFVMSAVIMIITSKVEPVYYNLPRLFQNWSLSGWKLFLKKKKLFTFLLRNSWMHQHIFSLLYFKLLKLSGQCFLLSFWSAKGDILIVFNTTLKVKVSYYLNIGFFKNRLMALVDEMCEVVILRFYCSSIARRRYHTSQMRVTSSS